VDATKVLLQTDNPPEHKNGGDACLVHIYPSGPAMGSRFPLGNKPLIVGRDGECDIRINDESVSRRHASIQPDGTGYRIVDLHSTNGTFVNELRVSAQALRDGDYLHIGNCICRYLAGGNVEAQYHEEIHRLTIMDALTDVYNRRYLLEFLGHELASSIRYRRPLAFAMFDVDHFKAINDRLGHLGGDSTLRELAGAVKGILRATDILARYGGEEFAVVMPDTSREQALICGERLRDAVASYRFSYVEKTYPVSISVGISIFMAEEGITTAQLIGQADANLMRAKGAGRNRVEG
jgi:diguanylate cyclase (GGDEF)-like protein